MALQLLLRLPFKPELVRHPFPALSSLRVPRVTERGDAEGADADGADAGAEGAGEGTDASPSGGELRAMA